MNKKLLEFTRLLSKQDKKTLSQTALKAVEELGELAKKVLPYDNADGTIHRFVQDQEILEEASDVILVALSIVHKLNFTDDELETMLMNKAKKWAGLQKEQSIDSNKIPFEIHITVKNANKKVFMDTCKLLEIKPIILHLQNKDGKNMFDDVMTSSTFVGTNREAFEEAKRISERLNFYGLNVVRKKIETVPWHPAAPTHKNPSMPKDCYFESHLQVLVINEKGIHKLSEIAKFHGAHLSQNVFKKNEDDSFTLMITYRWYDGIYETFSNQVERLKKDIQKGGFSVGKTIIEYSIYDTKVSHDQSWIEG